MLELGDSEYRGDPAVIGIRYKNDLEGEVIGWCDIHPPHKGINGGDIPAIWAVWIVFGHRGMGHGTRMMREVVEHIESLGYDSASLGVEHDNIPAIRMYRRVGFVATRYIRKAGTYKVLKRSHHYDDSEFVMEWHKEEV